MAKQKTGRKGNKICAAGIAWAKRTFDRYPSAYANMAASKYCKDPNYAKGSKNKKVMEKAQLRKISAELKKASAMHKGQAAKIDRMLKAMNKTAKKK